MIIQRPLCPACQTRMMLARITPGPCGFDIRTFECPACDHAHQSVEPYIDPTKSSETLAPGRIASTNLREMPSLNKQNQGPQCTACGSPMRLAAIEPSMWRQDLRTFACPHCKRVQQHIIESAVTEAWVAPKK